MLIMNKRKFFLTIVLALLVTACNQQKQAEDKAPELEKKANAVTIKDFAFGPATLTVSVGTTVTWTHDDGAPHTVTTSKAPEAFGSGNLTKGDSFSQTFDTTGTYEYFCSIHPRMTGTVVVQ